MGAFADQRHGTETKSSAIAEAVQKKGAPPKSKVLDGVEAIQSQAKAWEDPQRNNFEY